MSRYLVLGANSLIGRATVTAVPSNEVRPLPHQAAPERAAYSNVEAVLFAGRDPSIGGDDFDPDATAEFQAACVAAEFDLPFLSLGTGRVYAFSSTPWTETSPIGPSNRYGRNKLRLENRLAQTLGSKLTRLRIGNVFGFEPGHGTFMGQTQQTLRDEGRVVFEISPFTKRDFLPVDILGEWIAQLLRKPPGGIVNIGSGIALECGRLALWLIEGYGGGELVISTPTVGDEFVMDIVHLRTMVEASITPETLRSSILALGVQLQQAGA
ncbi:MAG: NAD-dependent epimerase/dehydratase family protein [Pseudomonadota bacterium]